MEKIGTRLAAMVFLVFFAGGCAAMQDNRESTVTLPNKDVYVVSCQRDAKVEWQDGDKKLVVDNRGQESMLDKIMNAMTLRWMRSGE